MACNFIDAIASTQMDKLVGIFRDMKKEELPKSREEFENRAILYQKSQKTGNKYNQCFIECQERWCK